MDTWKLVPDDRQGSDGHCNNPVRGMAGTNNNSEVETMNIAWLIYLGACQANGWKVSMKGYHAFRRQIEKGMRRNDGQMNWGVSNVCA